MPSLIFALGYAMMILFEIPWMIPNLGMSIRAFPAILQGRCGVQTATSTSGRWNSTCPRPDLSRRPMSDHGLPVQPSPRVGRHSDQGHDLEAGACTSRGSRVDG